MWPLTGRRTELELIDAVLRGDGPGLGLVFGGAPGIGKSRLLRAAMTKAADAGYVVELVAATRAGACVPLGAVSHLLPAGSDDLVHLFRCVAERWRDHRVVLVVDDADLLDDGSAALVHDLALRGTAVVIGAVRDGAQAPDAIIALWKDGLVRRHAVRPLPDDTVAELLREVLDGRVPESLHAVLCRLAEGNPLHLQAVVLDGIDSGALRQQDGVWQWQGASSGAWRLRELVAARLAGCDAAARSAVELVACGEPVPLGLVETDAGLVAAEQAGVLRVEQDGRRAVVRLAHPIYGEALRAGLGVLRTREIHRLLADRLEATGLRRRDDLLRMATWQLAAGTPPSASVALRAARQAMARHDLALAEQLARVAVDAGAEESHAVLADVLRWRGRHTDGIALVSSDPPNLAARSKWRLTRASILYWGLAHREEATAILAGSASATYAMMQMSEGRCGKAVEIAQRIADNESAEVNARLWAFTVVVCAHAMLGHSGVALAEAERGQDLAAQHEVHSGPYLGLARGHALLLAGRLAEARETAERGYAQAVLAGARVVVAGWAVLAALTAQIQGDLRAAADLLREATTIEEQQDPNGDLRLHLTVLAGVLAMSGAAHEAREALGRADALETPVPPAFRAQAESNRAWVLAAGGEHSRAVEVALAGARLAQETDLPCVEAVALHEAARHGAARQVRDRLAELAATCDSGLIDAYARSAAALAGQDGSRLRQVALMFTEMSAPLLAAESLVAASRAFRLAQLPREAAVDLARAKELLLQCPGATVPGIAGLDVTASLTPREREIAVLAITRSSQEIADRLRLSVRTVDNHLARVYGKLGISGRAELSELIG